MITAEQFLKRDESGVYTEVDIVQAMIEFAKLHVKAALEAKVQAVKLTCTYGGYSLEELDTLTKDAYPESNIK
jgi:hypothetical protein